MICGVCGGLAEYFEVDPSIVRIVFAIICLVKGFGVLLYFIMAMILPTKREIEAKDKIIDGQSSNFYE